MNHEILEARYTHGELVRKYDRIASVYDLFGILMTSKARQRALEMASIQNGEKVLEVALGTGLNFAEILKRNPHGCVQGIDVSRKMLERTPEKDRQNRAPACCPSPLRLPSPAFRRRCLRHRDQRIHAGYSSR